MTLIEVGRLEEAYEAAGQLEGAAAESGFREWRAARALTHILHGEYDQAAQTWTGEAQTLEDTAFGKLLGSIPVRDAPPPNNPWPLSLTVNAAEYYFQLPSQTSTLWMSAGLAQLEAGQLPKAIQSLRKALEKNPESADRRLIVFYLSQLTGEEYDILPPSESVPVLFEPEPAAAQ
jgi:tetratricopeptide (TPR) repeat protein